MAFCTKCGNEISENVRFCPNCGEIVEQSGAQYAPPQPPVPAAQTGDEDARRNVGMGVLAYLGPLVLIPIFAAKQSPFARFHANQGLVLLIVDVAYSILTGIVTGILSILSDGLAGIVGGILDLGSIAFAVLTILGIVNAAKKRTKELPVIGGFRILK